jgi:hypothetical protein
MNGSITASGGNALTTPGKNRGENRGRVPDHRRGQPRGVNVPDARRRIVRSSNEKGSRGIEMGGVYGRLMTQKSLWEVGWPHPPNIGRATRIRRQNRGFIRTKVHSLGLTRKMNGFDERNAGSRTPNPDSAVAGSGGNSGAVGTEPGESNISEVLKARAA